MTTLIYDDGLAIKSNSFTLTSPTTISGDVAQVGNFTETGNMSVSGTLTVGGSTITPARVVQTFTNAAGSARTDAGTGVTGYFTKQGSGANSPVTAFFALGNLATAANAVANAGMTFNETVPVAYRPAQNIEGIYGCSNNGAVNITGSWSLTTAGVLTFFGGLNDLVFVSGASCKMMTNPHINYNSAS